MQQTDDRGLVPSLAHVTHRKISIVRQVCVKKRTRRDKALIKVQTVTYLDIEIYLVSSVTVHTSEN